MTFQVTALEMTGWKGTSPVNAFEKTNIAQESEYDLPTLGRSTHLDHNHSKSENVCLFTRDTIPEQNLRCGPPRGMPLFRLDTHSVFALGDRCQSKITDACVSGIIYQDIWLGES